MKRNLYPVLIPLLSIFLMSLFAVSVHADGTINYTYDGSGNRVSAVRVINLRQAETDSTRGNNTIKVWGKGQIGKPTTAYSFKIIHY